MGHDHSAGDLSELCSAREQLWRWDALLYHNPHVPESFGRTVAEAMRAGCIPIVDNQGGFTEQVAKGCGFLCDNEGDFHSAIGEIQSLKYRRKLSQYCQTHADQTFSLNGFRKRLLKQFNRLGINAARENERYAVD